MNSYVIASLISLSGVFVTVTCTILLGRWTQKRLKEIEGLKADFSKEVLKHEIYVQNEFQIYKSMWNELIDLGRVLTKLRPSGQFIPSGKKAEQYEAEQFKLAQEKGERVIDLWYKNRPFYDLDVYKQLDKLTTLLQNELFAVSQKERLRDEDNMKYWKDGDKAIKECMALLDAICNTIRRRLGIYN